MDYPFVPLEWQVPITQNIYASVLVLSAQIILTLIFRRIAKKNEAASSGNIWFFLYTVSYSAPFLILLLIAALSKEITSTNIFLIACGAVVFVLAIEKKIRGLQEELESKNLFIERIESAGIWDAIIAPSVDDYTNIMKRAITGFSLLGVGAEKLTRDFDLFRETMNRCASQEKPVRFLLVAPDVPWVNEGSSRRGLGVHHFRDLLVKSLKKHCPTEERFQYSYRSKVL